MALRRLGIQRFSWLALVLGAGCATLAGAESGGENLPNAGAGPFRALRTNELGNLRSAPYTMDDDETFARDVAVIDADGDPGTPAVFGYFAITPKKGDKPDPSGPPRALVRYVATDGRSFDRTPITVLEAAEPWEGGVVGAPAAVRVGGEIFLYYASAGGIGGARSADGATFERLPGPLLGPDASGWEAGAAPKSPGVVRLSDGSLRMFYEIPGPDGGGGIGEARSEDGIHWTRAFTSPVILPVTTTVAGEAAYDSAWVGAPFPVIGRTAEGRTVLRVYYAARDTAGHRVIGLAARFDPDVAAPLARATSPVFGSGSSLGPGEPCVLSGENISLLFVTQRAGRTDSKNYPAVAVGVAPADATLPAR